jgi:ribosomal protein L37AE/L43A
MRNSGITGISPTARHGDIMKLQPFAYPYVKDQELGDCEECGSYTDDLRFRGRKWICEKCAENV